MKRHNAFTLIELLVVISIIALLIAILLPALNAARDAARSAECLSRYRQLGIVIETYRSDYNSLFPFANRTTDQAGNNLNRRGSFLYQIGQYIEPGGDFWGNSGMLHRDNPPAVNFFLCPGQVWYPTSNATEIRERAGISDGWRVHNYQMSAFFGFGTWDISTLNDIFGGPQKREILDSASQVPIVAGTYTSAHTRWGYTPRVNASTERSIFPHPRDTANWLFADGHATNVGNEEEVRDNVRDNRFIMWPRVSY